MRKLTLTELTTSLGNIVFTFGCAFVFAAVVEWPIQEVVKMLLPGPKRESPEKKDNAADSDDYLRKTAENRNLSKPEKTDLKFDSVVDRTSKKGYSNDAYSDQTSF